MQTKDFTGSYDWPTEEATAEASHFIEMIEDGEDQDYLCQQVIKTRQHWIKVFGTDEQGIADMSQFTKVFNDLLGPKLNFYM